MPLTLPLRQGGPISYHVSSSNKDPGLTVTHFTPSSKGYYWSMSLFDLGQRSLRFQNLNLFFSQTVVYLKPKVYMKANGRMGKNLYKRVWAYDQRGRHAEKLFKSSQEPNDQRPRNLNLASCKLVLPRLYKLTLSHFMARSNLVA